MKLSFNLGVLLLLMGGGGLGSRGHVVVHGRNVKVRGFDHGDLENVGASMID